MDSKTFTVTGMTCGHCADAVRSELSEIDGVGEIEIELVPSGTSSVTIHGEASDSQIAEAIDEAGYVLASDVQPG